MNKDEILAKYRELHSNLSSPYYQLKKQRSKALGLYLTPETLVETARRRVLKQLPAQARLAVRQAFENGQHRIKKVVRECDEDLNCKGKPYKRFSDLTPSKKDAVWEMILNEDEFNYEHQNIWASCNAELIARREELEAKSILTMDEEEELGSA